MSATDTIYITGTTEDGTLLIGGVWQHYRQNGFPVDISLLVIRDDLRALPDLCEMLADASQYSEGPQLMKEVPDLVTAEVKLRFMQMLHLRGYPERDYELCAAEIVKEKRKHGKNASRPQIPPEQPVPVGDLADPSGDPAAARPV